MLDSAAYGSTGRAPADRAHQFAPFAALCGYEEVVRGKESYVQVRRDMSDDEAQRLSSILATLERGDCVLVETYRDGAYVCRTGVLRQVDFANRLLRLVGESVAFEDIADVAKVDEREGF